MRLNESDTAVIESARIEIIVVQGLHITQKFSQKHYLEKIRIKSVDFPSPNGTVLQLNHAIKLKEPGKNLINGLIMELHFFR